MSDETSVPDYDMATNVGTCSNHGVLANDSRSTNNGPSFHSTALSYLHTTDFYPGPFFNIPKHLRLDSFLDIGGQRSHSLPDIGHILKKVFGIMTGQIEKSFWE